MITGIIIFVVGLGSYIAFLLFPPKDKKTK